MSSPLREPTYQKENEHSTCECPLTDSILKVLSIDYQARVAPTSKAGTRCCRKGYSEIPQCDYSDNNLESSALSAERLHDPKQLSITGNMPTRHWPSSAGDAQNTDTW